MTEGDLIRLVTERYLAGMECGFGRPGHMSPQWTGVPPLAAVVWDGYKMLFAFPIFTQYIVDPGDEDEVSSDL